MAITLTWSLRVAGDALRVYRATAPFDAASLPAPLAELAGDAARFDDTTAEAGTRYFYRVAVVLTGPPEQLALSDILSTS